MLLAYSPTREDSESFNILAKVATSVQGELSLTTQQEGGAGCTPHLTQLHSCSIRLGTLTHSHLTSRILRAVSTQAAGLTS